MSSCSPPSPPSGIALVQGAPTVFFKLCPERSIGALSIGRVVNNDYDHPKIVWSARIRDATLHRDSLTLTAPIPGYEVTSSEPFSDDARYIYVDAEDQDGVNLAGTVHEFMLRDLREGVLFEEGKRHPLDRWLGPEGPQCH